MVFVLCYWNIEKVENYSLFVTVIDGEFIFANLVLLWFSVRKIPAVPSMHEFIQVS